jgi:hypothetical protein
MTTPDILRAAKALSDVIEEHSYAWTPLRDAHQALDAAIAAAEAQPAAAPDALAKVCELAAKWAATEPDESDRNAHNSGDNESYGSDSATKWCGEQLLLALGEAQEPFNPAGERMPCADSAIPCESDDGSRVTCDSIGGGWPPKFLTLHKTTGGKFVGRFRYELTSVEAPEPSAAAAPDADLDNGPCGAVFGNLVCALRHGHGGLHESSDRVGWSMPEPRHLRDDDNPRQRAACGFWPITECFVGDAEQATCIECLRIAARRARQAAAPGVELAIDELRDLLVQARAAGSNSWIGPSWLIGWCEDRIAALRAKPAAKEGL